MRTRSFHTQTQTLRDGKLEAPDSRPRTRSAPASPASPTATALTRTTAPAEQAQWTLSLSSGSSNHCTAPPLYAGGCAGSNKAQNFRTSHRRHPHRHQQRSLSRRNRRRSRGRCGTATHRCADGLRRRRDRCSAGKGTEGTAEDGAGGGWGRREDTIRSVEELDGGWSGGKTSSFQTETCYSACGRSVREYITRSNVNIARGR